MTSGKPELTREKAIELLKRAVEEKGEDYVYPHASDLGTGTCLYVENGAPSCIVGHILYWVGVPLETISSREGDSAAGVAGAFTEAPDRVVRALDRAQTLQDTGSPWGEAVSQALERLGA